MKINTKMAIGDSVTTYPTLAKVYMSYGIDYCCGGDREIGEAIKDSLGDEQVIVNALNQQLDEIKKTGTSTIQLQELTNHQLIDHIVHKHHGFLREILPELSMYLFKLIEVHGQNHPELFQVHHIVGTLKTELEEHLIKEEQQLFPLINKKAFTAAKDLIKSLEKEHEEARDLLKELTVVTDHFKLPEDACNTYKVTYQRLQQLQVDMYEHVHKENSVLFKRIGL